MWKERYKIGVDLIDDQHKELFSILSNFIQTVQNDSPWEEKMEKAKETMFFMNDYVVKHFDEEEKYQEEINYPYIEEHKLAHAKFKEGIQDYVNIFNQGGFTEEKMQEFSGKLMAWLIMHVGHMDQKIGEYVKSKEVGN